MACHKVEPLVSDDPLDLVPLQGPWLRLHLLEHQTIKRTPNSPRYSQDRMSEIVVRPYRDEDREGFGHVRAMTYRGGQPVLPEEKLLRDDCLAFVAERNGRICGATTVLDMTASKSEAVLRCGGLAAVGVVPECRKSGVGGKMMADILRFCKDDGFHLASLYAFRESYYRRYGYEVCGFRFKISAARAALPAFPAHFEVRSIEAKNYAELEPCYRQFAKKYAGMNLRKPEQWWRALGGDTPLAIYAAGDPIEAYAVVWLSGDFWINQEVKEFIWTTQRGYESMFSLFHSLAMNKNRVEWFEPSGGPFLLGNQDHEIDISIARQIMFRVLDVPAVLRELKATSSGSFTLAVKDTHLPENEGPWRVSFSPNGVDVTPAQAADLTLSIQSFTQAYLGEPSLAELADGWKIDIRDPKALEAAEALLAPQRVLCYDFF